MAAFKYFIRINTIHLIATASKENEVEKMFVLYYLPCLDRRPSHKKSVSYLRIVFMKNLY